MGPGAALDGFLAEAPKSQVVIGPDGLVEPGKYDRVAVTVRDRGELRALRIRHGVRTAALAVWLDDATAALSLTSRPEWPALQLIRSRAADGGWLLVVRFAAPVPVHRVVAEVGRQAVWPDRVGHRGLVTDPWTGDKVPQDVVVTEWSLPSSDQTSEVTGRAPYVVTEPDGMLAVGPLDERVLNPAGFDASASEPTVDLADLDWGRGATEALVRRLRPVNGVRADLPQATPLLAARVMAGLAMAGVPLVADTVDPTISDHLGPAVTAAITTPVDLADAEAREEHSVVLRRAALTEFSSFGWRRRLGELAGVRVAHQPSLSVVMATRRPDLLEHAMGQVARQRGVDALELVLAPHGFEVDPIRVRELVGAAVTVQVVPAPPEAVFGDVLNAAAVAASGDVVVKMDDDDWYAPDFAADLLLARAYSGAALVGMPDDRYYLEPLDLTLRLSGSTEVYRQFVAGGTLMVERGLLHEVGGFRSVRRHVDAQLLAAVRAAGGVIYRAHGLGYCLRRTDSGHTWQADLDDLQSRAAQSWPGFRPGRLMEL